MIKIDPLYKSKGISVFLFNSTYADNYSVRDFNLLPAISFPLKAGYGYRSGKFESIIDTNTILFETRNTEFILTKYSEFEQDITLSIQFHESSFELIETLTNDQKAEAFRRTPQIEYLIRLFLTSYKRCSTLLIDQIIDDLLFQEVINIPSSVLRIKDIKPWVDKRVDTAKEYIHSHCSEPISIAQIAASSSISPFHFARVFKRKTGYSPYEYLMELRIAKAKQLLKKNYSVTSSAFEVGFNSVENFSFGFKKIVGVSPAEYKKSKIS